MTEKQQPPDIMQWEGHQYAILVKYALLKFTYEETSKESRLKAIPRK